MLPRGASDGASACSSSITSASARSPPGNARTCSTVERPALSEKFVRSKRGGACNNTGELSGVLVDEWGHGYDFKDAQAHLSELETRLGPRKLAELREGLCALSSGTPDAKAVSIGRWLQNQGAAWGAGGGGGRGGGGGGGIAN